MAWFIPEQVIEYKLDAGCGSLCEIFSFVYILLMVKIFDAFCNDVYTTVDGNLVHFFFFIFLL